MLLSNQKLIFAVLFIFALIYTSYGTTDSDLTESLDKRAYHKKNHKKSHKKNHKDSKYDIKRICKGFRFLYPYAHDDKYNQPIQIKNDSIITVMWAKDPTSEVDMCIDCEMLKEQEGLVGVVWQKGIDMKPGYASSPVHFVVGPEVSLPHQVVLRAFGNTTLGPRCAAYS
ncbi:22997_t:CDS:2 [Cetraspora pellucida]|uniref:22997_t:CDS:1 n=1 Tax=Cetraspora pellucida TaxID=1433469 RepID=A0A9N9E008_9GLOM|nr:22997_t:CDS:2 [Cetraspora pellucida]